MRRVPLRVLLLVAPAALAACGPRVPRAVRRPPTPPLALGVAVFEGVNVVRMDRDTVLRDQTVVVRDGRIDRVGPAASTPMPAGALRIDGRGRYLMPALADMDVQLSPNSWRLRRELALYVAHGVTMVRNLDGRSPHVRWRERVRRGEVLGPAILTCGPPIASDTSLLGRSDDLLGNRIAALGTNVERLLRDRRPAVSIRPEVMDQRRAGYDCVAVDSPSDWTPARYDALVAATRAMSMPLVGDFARNLPLDVNLRGRTTADRLDAYFREQLTPDAYSDEPTARDSLSRDVARRTRAAGVAVTTRLARTSSADRPLMRRLVRALATEDATLLLGTGATLRSTIAPGASAHRELRELVGAGLSPFEALRTATANPALVLGAPGDFGIVVPGARADLLLLDANPLEDVANTERLAGVMVRGRWLGAADLRRMRDEARAGRRRRGWLGF
ncbi:MAG: amidohydrolase family protein [Gemmatimonadaceae bacterium]